MPAGRSFRALQYHSTSNQTMFTAEQIKAAHSKVRSGADFPAFIRDIAALGVTSYCTYVADGHTDYYGAGGFSTSAAPGYAALPVAADSDMAQFRAELRDHQQGATNYQEFIAACARLGIEKWEVDMALMTCTYFDKAGNAVLVEDIPRW